MKRSGVHILLIILFLGRVTSTLHAQCSLGASNTITKCLEIESILVDACTTNEGLDEMTRIKIGPNPIPLNSLTNVTWTSANPWQGYAAFNASNLAKLVTINNEITAAGNCGRVIKLEPGDIVPANANMLLITSTIYNVYAQDFSGLTDTLYVALQNNTTVSTGHFNNYGSSASRTFIFGTSTCTDTVTYDRSLLKKVDGTVGAENGSTVYFTHAGVPTYGNTGCTIPLAPFSADASSLNSSYCKNDFIPLYGVVSGATCYKWRLKDPTVGTILDTTNLVTSFTPKPNFSGAVKIYLIVDGKCNQKKTDSIEFTILKLTDTLKITPISSGVRCNKLTVPLQATASSNSSILWSHTGKGNFNTISGLNVVYMPSMADTGIIWFKASQSVYCGKLDDSVAINFSASPKATFLPASVLVCANVPTIALNPVDTEGVFISSHVVNSNFITPTVAGIYPIKYVISRNGCSDSLLINIEVRDVANAQFTVSDTLVCQNTKTIILNTLQNGGVFSGATIVNKTFGTQTAGIFNIQYKIDNGVCADSVTKIVHVLEKGNPDFTIPDTILCEGDNAVTFLPINTGGIFSGNYVSSSSFNPVKAGYYSIWYKYGAGQCIDSSLHYITVLPKPTASFTINPIDVKVYDTISFTYTGSVVQSYSWLFGDGNTSTLQNPQHIYKKDETFPISLIVLNDVGCTDTAYKLFLVKADVHFYVPNAFTPNGDGANEKFMVAYTGIKKYNIKIYDRWGQLAYDSNDIDDGWNGTLNQKDCQEGVYVYVIQFTDSNGDNGKRMGNVTLLR